jgi:hypothetical protein
LITTCDTLEERRSTLFLKVDDIVKDIKGPPSIMDSMLLTRDHMETDLGILRVAWGTKFDDLANFLEDEIDTS